MSVIIDLVIIAILAICIIVGYVKGLTGCLIKILSCILSLVIAFTLFIPVSNFIIKNTNIDDDLEKWVRNIIVSSDNKEQKNEEIPEAMTDYINSKVEEVANNAKENIADIAAKDVAQTIVKAGTWIALFIAARIVLILLKFITSLIAKLPVIKQFDKLGGIIYGALEGLIIVYFALAVISFITPVTKGNLQQDINKSYIGGFMYQNNLLLKIIF